MDKDRKGYTREAAVKGRGTGFNQQSRFIQLRSEAVDDGWTQHALDDECAPSNSMPFVAGENKVDTQIFVDRTKTLITKNSSPDVPFSQSINPYKGCEHGCVYCFARPTHAYLDLSPGLDFESKIFRKTNIRECLLRELGRSKYRCAPIAMGTNTDPYQLAEKEHKVTREILEILSKLNHPVSIVTKSALIARDIDILADMADRQLVSVHVSVTTLDNHLKTKLEPRTAGPQARLKTIAHLRQEGVPVGVLVAPIIPFINDHEIEDIVSAAVDNGAQSLGYILLRLPLEVRPLFERWLEEHYPLKAERVMSAIRATRGGKAYQAQWHKRMVGEGPIADLIRTRFIAAQRKMGVLNASLPTLRTDLFEYSHRTPAKSPGISADSRSTKGQQSLF